MPIEIKSIDAFEVNIDETDYTKLSLWCFGGCLTERERSLIIEKKASYCIPTENMGVLSCKGIGGVHNVSFIGSDADQTSDDTLVWQFEIFADKTARIALKEGDEITLADKGR